MKRLILFVCLAFCLIESKGQCYDTCQFKQFLMFNNDTTKFNEFDISQQGVWQYAKHSNGNYITSTVDSYNSLAKFQGTSIGNGNDNVIAFDKTGGVYLASGYNASITAPVINLNSNGKSVTIKQVSSKLIVIIPFLPANCAGQVAGTLYKDSNNFLKICP